MDPGRERGVQVESGARTFLAERYWPGADTASASAAAQRLGDELEALARAGTAARALGCTFIPPEEALFVVVQAGSRDAVEDLGRRADIEFDRIVEAVVLPTAAPEPEDGA